MEIENDNLALINQPNAPVLDKNDELIDMGDDFDLSEFQVVRREFFAHTKEPSVTFADCKFYVNSVCLNKFPHSDYVQVMIKKETKVLVLRPCDETAKDCLPWSKITKHGKREPKATSSKVIFMLIADLMNWDLNYKYKMLGKLVHANGLYLIVYDLTAAETYKRIQSDDGKQITSRIPVYPLEWQNQFGMPFNEHEKALHVNIFDGYAIYTIKDKKGTTEEKPVTEGTLLIEDRQKSEVNDV